MNKLAALLIVGLAFSSSQLLAQSQDEMEITQLILDGDAYLNANNVALAEDYSQHGALEFWSSGGLLQDIKPGTARDQRYESINMQPKHIRVVTLVEGKVAVAHFYSEGSMKPVGSPAVAHYLTRVSQVLVKEGGEWKVRSSHFSPIAGGSGTSQVAEQTEK